MIALLLALLPALLLVLALLRGVYPAAGLIEHLRRRLRHPPVSAAAPLRPTTTVHKRRRRGELFSTGMAGRAPPSEWAPTGAHAAVATP